jgi:hypothetical protein
MTKVGWFEKGLFSEFVWMPLFLAYLNPSKTFEHKQKLNRWKISHIELENFVYCPKNAHFRKKWFSNFFFA